MVVFMLRVNHKKLRQTAKSKQRNQTLKQAFINMKFCLHLSNDEVTAKRLTSQKTVSWEVCEFAEPNTGIM